MTLCNALIFCPCAGTRYFAPVLGYRDQFGHGTARALCAPRVSRCRSPLHLSPPPSPLSHAGAAVAVPAEPACTARLRCCRGEELASRTARAPAQPPRVRRATSCHAGARLSSAWPYWPLCRLAPPPVCLAAGENAAAMAASTTATTDSSSPAIFRHAEHLPR